VPGRTTGAGALPLPPALGRAGADTR
jgi:hypothetical protein